MEWLKIFGRKNSKPDSQILQKSSHREAKLNHQEMEKALDLFRRTCWPSNYGDHTLSVDTNVLKGLRGPYLKKAKAAILKSLKKSPHVNSIIAATAIEMTEAVPVMTRWIQQVRSQEDKSESSLAYGELAYSLYSLTNDDAYLDDLVEAVRVSGFGDIAGSQVIYLLWKVPLTIDVFSAVWEKLKKGKAIRESGSWRDTCEDFLREKIDDPVGQVFLSTLSEAEQKEIRSTVAMTRNQKIERNSRFQQFVVDRYNKDDLNIYGEYIKVGGSPIPGLTLRCILEGHTKEVNCTAWSPDGRYLASAGSDNLIVIWDVRNAERISLIDGGGINRPGLTDGDDSDYRISHVAWSTDGQWIAFGSEEKGVGIWHVKQETFLVPPKREDKSVRKLAWAPGQNSLLYSFSDNTVWVRDIPSGKVRRIFQGCNGSIDALAWSSDAALIAAGYWDRTQGGKSNKGAKLSQPEILLWDVRSEKVITRVSCHDSYINHISWVPSQPILAAASSDATITIWNMQERRRIASLESHVSAVEGVAFSAGGTLLASTAERDDMVGGTVRLWRTDIWEELFIFKELGSAEEALAFHPSLPILATRCHGNPPQKSGNSTESCIRIWDLDIETFLRNPTFIDEFNRLEADFMNQENGDK